MAKKEKEEKVEDQADEKALSDKSEEVPEKLQKIIDAVSKLTVLEVSKLVTAMEDTFGVSAQAAVAMPMGMPMGGAGGDGEEEVEKTASMNECRFYGQSLAERVP